MGDWELRKAGGEEAGKEVAGKGVMEWGYGVCWGSQDCPLRICLLVRAEAFSNTGQIGSLRAK